MPRKGENIYKRKDGRWEGRYVKNRSATGKAIYGYVYARTYRDVKRKVYEARSSTEMHVEAVSCDTEAFSYFAEEWMNNMRPQVKESTNAKYQNILDSYLLPCLGEKMLSQITHELIEEHCRYLLTAGGKSGRGLSSKTVADTLSVLRSILHFAVRKGKYVPYDGTHLMIKHFPDPMRVLSRTEQAHLCKYLYSHMTPCHMGILICLFTGLRIGEVCALRWEDFSCKDRTFYVHQTLQRIQCRNNPEQKTKIIITSPKSRCSIRTIPVPHALLEILTEYKTSGSGFVLTNSDSLFVEPRTMQNHFKRALQATGIERTNFHTTRHTFATRCIEMGFDVKTLSEILGHATVNITMNRYVHPTMELKKENMDKLSTLLAVK